MAYEYQNFASLGVNLNRQAYGALDISAVFKSEADLTWYMTYGKESSKPAAWSKVEAPYPYEGQIVSVVPDTGVVTVYVLEAEKNEGGKIQSYDDGKVKLVKKTLSIADSAVSSVNGLTGAISIIPEPDSIIKVEKDSNNIKIGADTSGLIKINSNNIVDGNFSLSSGSVSVSVSGEGISISNSQTASSIIVAPTGIISDYKIDISSTNSSGEVSINGKDRVSIDGTGEITIRSSQGKVSIDGKRGVKIGGGTEAVSIVGTGEVSITCDRNLFKFRKDVYDSPSEDNTYYVATEKYVDDKVANISSNKITSPDGYTSIEIADRELGTDDGTIHMSFGTGEIIISQESKGGPGYPIIEVKGIDSGDEYDYKYKFPSTSGTIALTSDIPGPASTTELGIVKLTESVLDDDTLVPTAGAVHTAIEQVKTEMAGGVIYKGGVANPSVSETNVTLTGVQTPIRPGYMYSITSGSIAVDEVTYSVGDYIIYKGASEASTTTVPASDLTFINAVGSDVVKLNVENTGNIDINGDIQAYSIHVSGSGEIFDLLVGNKLYINSDSNTVVLGAGEDESLIVYDRTLHSRVTIPTTKSGTVALTSDIKTYTAKANSGITLTNTEFSGVDATTAAKGVVQLASDMTTDNLVPTVGVVKTEIQKLTQGLTGTKQLDEKGGNYTVKDIVSLLNKVAALLGAPVYTA